MTTETLDIKPGTDIHLPLRSCDYHPKQRQLVISNYKRIIVRAGRRGGKTVGAAIKGVFAFLEGRRVLYAAPTSEQTDKFWYEVKRALRPMLALGIYKLNETEQTIIKTGTENRLKAKTAWNANTLRGDFADLLILDEFQLMNEDTWDEVGAPMLLDNNGDAVFIYTPASLVSEGVSKAKDPRHAGKLFKRAASDMTGAWEAIHFTSHENPYISHEALDAIVADMSTESYRREILAEDDEIEQGWLVYGKFNERVCRVARFPIPKEWFIYVGHDFGLANPAALFLAQNPASGDFFIWKEYSPGPGLGVPTHVVNFQEIVKGHSVLKRVGGNITTEQDSRDLYTAHGWPITAPKITRVNAQIEKVIGLLELNKLYIFEDLKLLLAQIASCMWKLADNKPTNVIKDEARYHLLACLRYIGSEFVPEMIPRGRPQRISMLVSS